MIADQLAGLEGLRGKGGKRSDDLGDALALAVINCRRQQGGVDR
jgi:hypothetical protein